MPEEVVDATDPRQWSWFISSFAPGSGEHTIAGCCPGCGAPVEFFMEDPYHGVEDETNLAVAEHKCNPDAFHMHLYLAHYGYEQLARVVGLP